MQGPFQKRNTVAGSDGAQYRPGAMKRSPLDDLRRSIDCLPRRTRVAMLEGVRAEEIIVGAYTDERGGVCPMLAAHRRGGRTSFISFARAWDAFARVRKPRPATGRELRILAGQLEASLLAEDRVELTGAITEHQALSRARRAREAAGTGGWGFLRRRRAADATTDDFGTPGATESHSREPRPVAGSPA